MTRWIGLFAVLVGSAAGQSGRMTVPKIWDDHALEDWATPIAGLDVRPGHFTAAEYYAIPADNLRSYPVYRPDREPPGYWEWLQKQKPQPLVDATKLRTESDWVKAGEVAFQTLGGKILWTNDPEKIKIYRDLKAFEGVWTRSDGSLLVNRWVVTGHGIELRVAACTGCHARARADGSVFWAAPEGGAPAGTRDITPLRLREESPDPLPLRAWRNFTVPWAPDERIEKLLLPNEGAAFLSQMLQAGVRGTAPRPHGSPYHMTKTPDLNNLQYSRYIDATGTHRLRGPEDIARYSAFISGADPREFGPYRILPPERRRMNFRYADEVLYSIGVYLMSLQPPRNPQHSAQELIDRGRHVFERETCMNCHIPPDYTSGKLTLAQGYAPANDHPYQSDILKISVATDPGLALKTRKGTGFYKIPSLRGLWYRPLLLHDGSVASLEEMFDPDRLKPDHEPGGWKGPGVTKRAIPGHPFGLALNTDDRNALLAFLRSI